MEDDDEGDIPRPINYLNKHKRRETNDKFKNVSGQDADLESDYCQSRSELRKS